MTALMYAAQQGYDDIVRILVKKEAGMKDEYGKTALMKAAENGHLECVKILAPLEKGMKNNDGKTALYYTTHSSNKECAQFLWQFPEERETKDWEEIKRRHNLPRV